MTQNKIESHKKHGIKLLLFFIRHRWFQLSLIYNGSSHWIGRRHCEFESDYHDTPPEDLNKQTLNIVRRIEVFVAKSQISQRQPRYHNLNNLDLSKHERLAVKAKRKAVLPDI